MSSTGRPTSTAADILDVEQPGYFLPTMHSAPRQPSRRQLGMHRSSEGSFGRLSTGQPLRVIDSSGKHRTSMWGGGGRSSFTGRPSLTGMTIQKKPLARPSGSGAGVAPVKKRKSSMSSMRSATGRIKDPRSVTDRAFKEREIRQLVEYLMENSYPFPITAKLLHSPQTKDFVRIFEFLIGFLQPKYKVVGKMEEAIPARLKELGYPFNITKSAMFSVGSPLTWPALLAALSWLRELVEYAVNVEVDQLLFPPAGDDGFDAVIEHKRFFDYCETSYRVFMGGANTFEELDEVLSKQFADSVSQTNMDELAQEKKHLELDLQTLLEAPDELLKLKDMDNVLNRDIAQLQTYNNEMDLHLKQQDDLDSELTTEVIVLEAEKQQILTETDRKRQILKQQTLSAGDVERFHLARQDQLRQVAAMETEVATLDNQIWANDMDISKSHDKLEAACTEYHKMARMLQLIPVTAEHACGVDYQLKATTNNTESDKFVNVIRPALSQVKKQCTERGHMLQERMMKEKEILEQVTDMVGEKKEGIAVLENKLKRHEVNIDHKRALMLRESQSAQARIDEVLEQQSTLYKHTPASIGEARLAVDEQKQRCEQNVVGWEKDERSLINYLVTAAKMVMAHKHDIQAHMRKVREELEEKLEEEKATSRREKEKREQEKVKREQEKVKREQEKVKREQEKALSRRDV